MEAAPSPRPAKRLVDFGEQVSRPGKGFLLNAFAVLFFGAMAAFASWLVVIFSNKWAWLHWPAMALLAGAGGFGLYVLYTTLREAARRQDTPTSTIRGAAQGAVEVRGHVHFIPGRELASHLLDIACVAYSSKLEGLRTSEMDDTLVDVSGARSFLLRDGTGEVFVPATFGHTGLAAKAVDNRREPPAHIRCGDTSKYDCLRVTEWVVPTDIDAQANGYFLTLRAYEDFKAAHAARRDGGHLSTAEQDWRAYADAAMAAAGPNAPPPRLNVLLPIDGGTPVWVTDPADDQSGAWDAAILLVVVSAMPITALLDALDVIAVGPLIGRAITLAATLW